MAPINVELDAAAATAIILATSTLYLLGRPVTVTPNAPPPPLRRTLSFFLLVHTLYMVYIIVFARPPNIFSHFGIPLSLPPEKMRLLLIKRAGGDGVVLAKAVEGLLTRLTSFEMRAVFIRFGQALIQDCEYCRTFDEFALHALPRPLLQYARTAALVGLLTANGSYRARWRSWGIWALILAAGTEVYWIATVPIKITAKGDEVVYWHDLCWTLRHLFFLLLPAVIHFAPTQKPVSAASAVRSVPLSLQTLERALQKTHTMRLMHASVMRNPSLSESALGWWNRGRRVGAGVRADVNLRRMAERIKMGFGHEGGGELRKEAQETAEGIRKSIIATVQSQSREGETSAGVS